MRRIFRIFIFSCFALFLTSYWNKGFIFPLTIIDFIKAGFALTLLFVVVRPIMKVVFLPLNILTFGLFSFFLYICFLYILSSWFSLFLIQSWKFNGISLGFINIPQTYISYIGNLVLSSMSISGIINALDQVT